MKKLISFLFCVVIIAGCESPNDNVITEDLNIINIELSVNNSVLNVNDSLCFTLKVANTSSKDVLFYKYNSEYENLPYVSLNITPDLSNNSGDGVYNYGYGCWIEEENFISLKPNQSTVLYNNSTELFRKYSKYFQTAGTYKVSAIVDFDDVGIINWPKEEGEKAKLEEMFNHIPKESFTSNEIEITVK